MSPFHNEGLLSLACHSSLWNQRTTEAGLPGFSCRTGYGCKRSWFTHSTSPRRARFSSKALEQKKIYHGNIVGRDYWSLCNRMKTYLAENGMIGNFWVISLKINLEDFIFRW